MARVTDAHIEARKAQILCPDTTTVWPTYYPFSEHTSDPFWSTCFTTTSAP